MRKVLNRIFHLDERNGKFGIEILAGFVTFIAMIYILPINSEILSQIGRASCRERV